MKTRILIMLVTVLGITACSSDNEDTAPAPIPTAEFTPLDVAACLVQGQPNTCDVVTWNLEQFPLNSLETITLTADLVRQMDADLIAVQEIRSSSSFAILTDSLQGWESSVFASSNLNLGFLHKTGEITITEEAFPIYSDLPSPFPREPLVVTASHTNGLSITFINIHLKCCDGEDNEERRREASRLLKEYIDNNHPNDNVVLLGDFNDLIVEETQDQNVFLNFMTDSLNYRFATQAIAQGGPSGWSYPSWPSHIDHILISDELFDNVEDTQTLAFDACDARYTSVISDHRPVLMRLKSD